MERKNKRDTRNNRIKAYKIQRGILNFSLGVCILLTFLPMFSTAAEIVKNSDDYALKVYIDPDVISSGNGSSPANPLKSWSQVSFQANTAYLQKRGTTDTISSGLAVNASNTLLGAYGNPGDPRPVIYSTSTNHIIDGHAKYITIRDLEVVSPVAAGKSGIRFAIWNDGEFGTIYNCYIHGVDAVNFIGWGVRFMGYAGKVSQGNRLLKSEIKYTGDDGIFVQNSRNAVIGDVRITKVNQHWFTDPGSGGDGIQLDGNIGGFHIHHCYVDRTDTGNKQGIIVNPSVADVSGIIENNQIKMTGDRAAVFCGSGDNYRPVIRNNIIENTDQENGGVGAYLHADYPEVYNNVFIGHSRGVSLISPLKYAKVHHNTFHRILYNGIYGVRSFEARNNIFAFDSSFNIVEGNSAQYSLSHNLFLAEKNSMGDNPVIGDPGFFDADQYDYHIGRFSPAVDRGNILAGITFDADGNSRSGRPDLGAYEYLPGEGGGSSLSWLMLLLRN